MKKIISFILSAVMTFSLAATSAFGMTFVDDAETAVQKNKELFLKMWDETEVTVNFTREQVEELLFGACEYSADKFVGAGFMVDNFRVKSPTSSSAGYVSADVIIYQEDAEEGFSIKKEIPASAAAGEDEDISDGEEQNTNDSFEIDDAAAKKEIEAASKAISAAIFDFDVSNDTTRKDILNMAKEALPEGSHVSIAIDPIDFKIVKASTTVNGTMSAALELSCGTQSKRIPVGKTIQPVVTETSIKIDEDRHEVSVAVSSMTYSNTITKELMLETAKAAVKNGSVVTWENFTMTKSTFDGAGKVAGTLTLKLDEETRSIYMQEEIPKLVGKMPTDKISINRDEWEILRCTNIERAKEKLTLYSTTKDLQDVCDVRGAELFESYSHTRPNGEICFTALTEEAAKPGKKGENIAMDCAGRMTGKSAVNMWMNSPGHRANILTPEFVYMGVGLDNDGKEDRALQMFTSHNGMIVSVQTSAGTMNFKDEYEMQKEYLICTSSNGIVSYMPLDTDFMEKVDGGYKLNLNSEDPVIITIGSENAAKQPTASEKETQTQNTGEQSSSAFEDVAADAYYANAVKWAVERNITAGTSKTTFSPNNTCTRAQILSFLWRAVGSPKMDSANPFSDVTKADYYYDAAIWASQKGMVSGSTFAGETPCTRSSTVVYMWKNADAPSAEYTGEFNDVQAGTEYAQAVAWALDAGVTSGTSDTTFSPDMICSRGQIVTFLNRAIK